MTEDQLNEKKITLCEMIGSYSQEVYYCSYNDDSVLCALLSGTMKEELLSLDKYQKKNLETDGWNVETFYDDMMKIVNELKVWGSGWHHCEAFKDLSKQYKDILVRCKREDLLE